MLKWFLAGAAVALAAVVLARRPWNATIAGMAGSEYPPGYQ